MGSALDPLGVFNGSFVDDIPRIYGRGWFQQQDIGLLLGDRPMFYSGRHNKKLAFFELDPPIAQFDIQPAFHDQEHFVCLVMVMPDELAYEFDNLDVLSVELCNDPRRPVFVQEAKFICKDYFIHMRPAFEKFVSPGAKYGMSISEA